MSKPVIVCVDDEKFVLDSLRTTLSQAVGDDYVIEIAEDGTDALEVVKELLAEGREVPLVISDYVMPLMRGDELLRHIQIVSQKTLKIMLTGQANIEGVTNAVNEADLYRFIAKPWNSNQLVQIVRQAVREYFLDKERDDRSRALLDATPDRVLFLRRDGLVLQDYRGPAPAQEAGGPNGETPKCRLEDLFPAEVAARFRAEIAALPAGGKCVAFEFDLLDAGLPRFYEVRITPCGAEDVLAVARDVTAQKEVEESLRAAKEEAERANRAKSSFLSAMSHEIRTPLNSVIGFSNLLLETHLNAEQFEFTDTLHRSAETLLSVVNDILDFSKIEAGRIELEQVPFNLREAVDDCLALIMPDANRKGLEVCALVDDECPELLLGDVTRLRQVLTNLLTNAVKFTETGEIDVTVKREPAGDDANAVHLRFQVRDTGIGMSASQRARILEPFIQADASTTRRFGGTGLGLAISRRLVELMGGHIVVESQAGQGSSFRFNVRMEIDPHAAAAVAATNQSRPLAGLRVAVVDDNDTNRRYLSLQMEAWGAEALAFESGAAILAFLEDGGVYDVLLMDYHMPVMDGLEAAKAARARPAGRAQPILLLSSGISGQDVPSGLFARVFTKPVNPRLLKKTLALLAGSEPLDRPVDPAASQLAAKYPLRILLAEDNPANQKLGMLVLSRLGYRAEVVANGHEAIAALQARPFDVVLMDVQMPDMDGLEATRLLREILPAEHRPTVIALTAHASKEDHALCRESGMDDYLTKPLRPELLVQALVRAAQSRA